MAVPTLTPSSEISATRLPETGSFTGAKGATKVANYPYGIYADSSSDLYDLNFVWSDNIVLFISKIFNNEFFNNKLYANLYEGIIDASLFWVYFM